MKGQWFSKDKGALWGGEGHALAFFDGMMHSKKEIMKQMKPKFDEAKALKQYLA